MSTKPTQLAGTPPFDEAVSYFRSFLSQQGVSDKIQWIWRNAIISRRCPGSRKSANRRIYIDLNTLADEGRIRSYYDAGAERGLGVALQVFCTSDGISYCYIYVPEDETAAEYAMMSSLKCSVPDPCPEATTMSNRHVARACRFLLRTPRNAWITKEVPCHPVGNAESDFVRNE